MHASENDDGNGEQPRKDISSSVCQEDNEEEEEAVMEDGQLPIRCHLDALHKGMFRVTRAKGKPFSSGGFGVAFSTEIAADNDGTDHSEGEQDGTSNVPTTKESHDYLFLEEVLFLFERGMLQCQATPPADDNEDDDTHLSSNQPVLAAPQLYALLETFQIPTIAYLVYAHLRQQTFRVVRYTPQRLFLLRQLLEPNDNGNNNDNTTTSNWAQRKTRLLQLRSDVQNAPPPAVVRQPKNNDNDSSSGDNNNTPSFAFCVYPPDCTFARSNPGLPAFLVAVTDYGQPWLNYATLQSLLQQAQGIPIKLATVSDSGTVVMFGITDYGVPPLHEGVASHNHKDSTTTTPESPTS